MISLDPGRRPTAAQVCEHHLFGAETRTFQVEVYIFLTFLRFQLGTIEYKYQYNPTNHLR